jgi:hypothetical protein
MKSYTVNKFLNKKPRIMGLEVPLFFGFIGLVIICSLLFLSNIKLVMFFILAGVLAAVYIILLIAQKVNIGRLLFSEKLPDVVVNDNF